LFSAEGLAAAEAALPMCVELLKECQVDASVCREADAFYEDKIVSQIAKANRDQHDIRVECHEEDVNKCYDLSYVTKYISSAPVLSYLNVSKKQAWEECSPKVARGFVNAGDVMRNFGAYVADLLNFSSVRVLIYAGDADLVCNWYGTQAWTKALEWQYKAEFNAAQEHALVVGNGNKSIEAGRVRTFENQFTFIRVFNSGHMVPRDQPAVALTMINRFFHNDAF
jgi:carboxypeptidase C (cathepsin A)